MNGFTYSDRYGEHTEPVPSEIIHAIAEAQRFLKEKERASERASRARAALEPGSSRARVTTANANWAVAAEARERAAARLAALERLVAPCEQCHLDHLLYGHAYFEMRPDGTHEHYSPARLTGS